MKNKKKAKKGKKEEKSSKKADKKKKKKGDGEEKSTVKKDKWGSREGTQAAKINAAISKKAKSMKELMDEVGAEATFYNYMKKLIEDKHVVKTEKGYKLAS